MVFFIICIWCLSTWWCCVSISISLIAVYPILSLLIKIIIFLKKLAFIVRANIYVLILTVGCVVIKCVHTSTFIFYSLSRATDTKWGWLQFFMTTITYYLIQKLASLFLTVSGLHILMSCRIWIYAIPIMIHDIKTVTTGKFIDISISAW